MSIDNNVVTIEGVHGYIDPQGTVWLKLADAAIGLGFTFVAKSGNAVVRWNRVKEYLRQINFAQLPAQSRHSAFDPNELTDAELKECFIPESVFYVLGMKASNEIARAFQHKVAFEILPAIRKHGFYATPDAVEQIIADPDSFIRVLTALKEERAKNAALTQAVQTLEPKANYCDIILNCPNTVTTTIIAKDYGMSAKAFNEMLSKLKIQYKHAKTWALYQTYANKGYMQSKTYFTVDKNNEPTARVNREWTQTGRMFLYNTLRKHDIYPMIEKLNTEGDEE